MSKGTVGLMTSDWESQFRNVWDRGVAAWNAGRKSARTMFSAEDITFLTTIGCGAQELFDFVDDHRRYGDVEYDTVLAVTEIRYRYFLEVMQGKATGRIVTKRELPPKSAAVDGISWLPRLIAKARLKLRGELDPDLMYGCGGDRPFLEKHHMTLPEFLQLVWDKGDDDRGIVDAVKAAAGSK
jgi:hypothetical protein